MSERIALRVTALGYAFLYLVATFLPTLPEGADTDASVLRLFNDSGERTLIVLGSYALALSGVAFLAFTGLLDARIRKAGSSLGSLALAGGIGYGVALMVASTYFGGIATGAALGELPAVEDSFLVRAISNQGFHVILVPGLLAAAVVVVVVSTNARALLPRWCAVSGLVVGPLLLVGFTWAPQLLVPVWAVTVAFAMRTESIQTGSAYDSSSRSAAA